MALYLQAVREHDSVQACNSLYALYTPSKQERGLVRSDTRATRALIHALQIWSRKRWPQQHQRASDVSTETTASILTLMNLEPMLEHCNDVLSTTGDHPSPSYHNQSLHQPSKQSTTTSQLGSSTSPSSTETKSKRLDLLESFFADGSSRFWRKGRTDNRPRSQDFETAHRHHRHHPSSQRGALTDDNMANSGESEDDEDESMNGDSNSDIGDGDDGINSGSDFDASLDEENGGGVDLSSNNEDEEELDPEQRGQATGEIEDIVQKLCQMVQKGVLSLDEPIVMDAIAMLQWLAQQLAIEALELRKQERQENLLQQSSLGISSPRPAVNNSYVNGQSHHHNNATGASTDGGLLLLSQPLHFPDDDDEAVTNSGNPMKQISLAPSPRSARHGHRASYLMPDQRAIDQTFCRAIRIRIMSMLGWVHHQRREYKYAAQAYAVCSEVTPRTGRIQVDTLQRKAVELMRHCQEMELQQRKDDAAAAVTAVTTVCSSSGTSMNSVPFASASLHQTFDVSTPSTVSVAETSSSVCPLSVEGEQSLTLPQQSQEQQVVVADDAQVLEAAIRLASLAMESSFQPTVYEGGQVLAAEREARQRADLSTVEVALAATSKVHNKGKIQQQSSIVSPMSNASKGRKSRGRSRARISMDTIAKSGSKHPSPIRHQTESNLVLGKTGSSITKATAIELPSSHRPSMGSHSQSMPLLQPNHQHHRPHHHHHRHSSKPQQASRPKASGLIFGQPPKNPTQIILSTCGHCGKTGTQMPLCVCKTIRYCNRDCRVADMQVHRASGCHAALIGGI
ncbi:hypothetical protein BGW41_002581 [Actinomortierella wolfii]|nr:hypothetical protein BGW41_002581 [Actinomortierella wolfii]